MSILTLIVYIFKLRHYKICYYIFILNKKDYAAFLVSFEETHR